MAERDGPGWRLSGTKKWISNAPDADFYVVFARTTSGAGARGLTAFVVEGDAAGLSGEPLSIISPHAIGTLELDGVKVLDKARLGEVDGGFKVAMGTLNVFRPSVGAGAVGMAQAALDAAVAHADGRHAFGEAATRVPGGVPRARGDGHTPRGGPDARLARGGRLRRRRARRAEAFGDGEAVRDGDGAVRRRHGRPDPRSGSARAGHLLEGLYRDVRSLRIYEGTSEIQREIVARELYRG